MWTAGPSASKRKETMYKNDVLVQAYICVNKLEKTRVRIIFYLPSYVKRTILRCVRVTIVVVEMQ